MAIADGCHDGDGEQKGIWEVPVPAPALHLTVIVEVLGSAHYLSSQSVEVSLYLTRRKKLI